MATAKAAPPKPIIDQELGLPSKHRLHSRRRLPILRFLNFGRAKLRSLLDHLGQWLFSSSSSCVEGVRMLAKISNMAARPLCLQATGYCCNKSLYSTATITTVALHTCLIPAEERFRLEPALHKIAGSPSSSPHDKLVLQVIVHAQTKGSIQYCYLKEKAKPC